MPDDEDFRSYPPEALSFLHDLEPTLKKMSCTILLPQHNQKECI